MFSHHFQFSCPCSTCCLWGTWKVHEVLHENYSSMVSSFASIFQYWNAGRGTSQQQPYISLVQLDFGILNRSVPGPGNSKDNELGGHTEGGHTELQSPWCTPSPLEATNGYPASSESTFGCDQVVLWDPSASTTTNIQIHGWWAHEQGVIVFIILVSWGYHTWLLSFHSYTFIF